MANKNYTLMELEAIKKLCKSVNLIANLPADLIADTNVATNTTYSSYRIDAEMSALETDIQAYVDTALAGLNKLTKEVIDDKALVVKENVLYLYKDPSDINNDYMQMMLINGVAIELGSTTCDFNSVYSKDEIDDKFALKIDLDVLTTSFNNLVTTVENKIDKDKIVTVLDDTVTDEQVASAKAVVDELDKKANDDEVVKKTDITTTIDSSSTDDKVPSAKAVNIRMEEKLDKTTFNNSSLFKNGDVAGRITDANELPQGFTTAINLTNSPASGYWVCYLTLFHNNDLNYVTQLAFVIHTSNIHIRTSSGKVWGSWMKICPTTSVADVGVTTITPVNSGITGTIEYTVKNGICYVSMKDIMSTISSTGLLISTTMPKPSVNCNAVSVNAGGNIATIYIDKGTTNLRGDFYTKNAKSDCSFSYPVAE